MYNFVYSDAAGNAYVDEKHYMMGRLGAEFVEPLAEEMIPMPPGASFISLPERETAVLTKNGKITKYAGPGVPVGALLPQGYTRTLLPAVTGGKTGKPLPLFGYTALGFREGKFYVAALKTDDEHKWDPVHFNTPDLREKIDQIIQLFPTNRIIKQLAHCAERYGCFTAQNIFYRRWEGGIPVSPACNAGCIGCISLQESECCPSPQKRINFSPDKEEIEELMRFHIGESQEAIISFGQGCEGEPSLEYKKIAPVIRRIKAEDLAGTVNMNTNAGHTEAIKELVVAGIDSLRISLNSADDINYRQYYRPQNYGLCDVVASLEIAAAEGVFTYLNLLYFPGFNDLPSETEKLLELIGRTRVKGVQLRNLNIDPDLYYGILQMNGEEPLGVRSFIEILEKEYPELEIGNYTKPKLGEKY